MREQVEQVLEQIRPAIQGDGGDIELIDINEETGVVKIQFQGACVGCPMSGVTLKLGIEAALQQQVAGITKVIAV